jgi:triosephosphate isomerase
MNGDKSTIDGIVKFLNEGAKNDNVDIVVAPPTPYLDYAKQKLTGNVLVAAQNCYKVGDLN